MAAGAPLYRALVRLYPRDFRVAYDEDLHQVFADLVDRDGAAATWRRTAVDLAVTVPRYRLESFMSSRRSSAALVAVVLALVVGAVVTFAAGFGLPAAVLIVLAIGIAAVERTQLARSLRAERTAHRRRRWTSSAVCALAAVLVLGVAMADLQGENQWPMDRVLIYNILFFGPVMTALVMFVGGLRRPRVA
jgi:hypothetical protein